MDTKALRQKIFDLAIRGKLVPQDPNDEPASVLLEKIREQKQQMFKEGKLKKKDIKNDSIIFKGEDNLHYEKFQDGTVKCIEDEIPFELPEGWAWARIFSITEDLPYGTAKKSMQTGLVAVLRMGNIQSGEIDYSDLVYSSDIDDIAKYTLIKNDLLFNRTNSAEWVGKTAIYRGNIPAMYAGYLIRMRAFIDSEYLNVVMNSGYAKAYCNSVKTDGVNQSNINAQKLGNFLVPIPSPAEQKRISTNIVDFIPRISMIQGEKEHIAELILQTKAKILDLAMRGKLVPQNPDDEPASVLLERIRAEKEELIKQGKIKRDKKESIIFKGEDNSYYQRVEAEGATVIQRVDIPSTWEVCHLQDISYPISSIGMQIKSEETQKDGLFPVISQGKSYIDGYCSDESKVIYDFPIILFGDHTRNVKYIDFPFIVGADGTKLHKIIQANEKYVYYWMCHASEHIADRGYARHYNLLQKKCFMLPPFAEQNRIVNCIEKLFAQLNSICDALS